MLVKLKIKKQILIILLLLCTMMFSKGQDTIVRKRYLDSVKNQLALHITGYYTYLNLFERAENDRKRIYITLQATQNKLQATEDAWKRQNTMHGIFFAAVGALSMLMIYILKK